MACKIHYLKGIKKIEEKGSEKKGKKKKEQDKSEAKEEKEEESKVTELRGRKVVILGVPLKLLGPWFLVWGSGRVPKPREEEESPLSGIGRGREKLRLLIDRSTCLQSI